MFDRKRAATVARNNVLGLVAIFIALGGVAFALQNNSVKSKHIKNGQVKTPDLANKAVKGSKVRPESIGADQIVDATNTIRIGPEGLAMDKAIPPAIENFQPSGSAQTTASVLIFGPSTAEHSYFTLPVPDDWDGTSEFVVRILWSVGASDGGGSGDVRWELNTSFSQEGGSPNLVGGNSAVAAAPPSGELAATEINLVTPNASAEYISGRLSRNGGHSDDTLSAYADLHHVEVKYGTSR